MLIDSHLHIKPHMHPDELVRYMDNLNIDQAWLLSWEEDRPAIPEFYKPLSINHILEAHKQYPNRFVPFYAADPSREDIDKVFKETLKDPIKGCGELKVTLNWDSPKILSYLEKINERGLPLIFHMEKPNSFYLPESASFLDKALAKLLNGGFNGLAKKYIQKWIQSTGILKNKIQINSRHFPGYMLNFHSLESALYQYPNIHFIGHGPHFWNHISWHQKPYLTHQKGKIKKEGITCQLLRKYPNMYADLSGVSAFNALKRDQKFTKPFLEEHHQKLLFGTDNYDLGQQNLIEHMNLPDYKTNDICWKNAQKLIH